MVFARDPLSVSYDGAIDAFLSRLQESVPSPAFLATLPGGQRSVAVEVNSPPGDPGDGTDSDLNLTRHERAWYRAVYNWTRKYGDQNLSIRVDWTSSRGPQGGRVAIVRVLPYVPGAAAPPGSYSANPALRAWNTGGGPVIA